MNMKDTSLAFPQFCISLHYILHAFGYLILKEKKIYLREIYKVYKSNVIREGYSLLVLGM